MAKTVITLRDPRKIRLELGRIYTQYNKKAKKSPPICFWRDSDGQKVDAVTLHSITIEHSDLAVKEKVTYAFAVSKEDFVSVELGNIREIKITE